MNQENQNNIVLKPYVWMPMLLGIAVVFGMIIGTKLQPSPPTIILEDEREVSASGIGQGKIEELIRYIEAKYVDDVNRDELIQKAIENVLENLDPHSNYIPSDQLREVNEQLEGNFEGIGVEFMILEDTIVVVSPLAGGPSEAAGILAGDKIVAIEDSTIAGVGITSKGVMDLLRGEKGSEVGITIKRDMEDKLLSFNIVRDRIPVNSVEIAYMLDKKTGYIKINRFSATTYEEFKQGLSEMVNKDEKINLIIDLRHNPGGYLKQATRMLNLLFKEKGKLLVYTEGRTVNRDDYSTTGQAAPNVEDIVVLIDEGAASASEIMAGALQDHDRGLIIGRRSFGKGLVQEQYALRDGSALRLTVARYYTPSGRSIQKSYKDSEEYDQDVMERYTSGELSDEEQISVIDSTEYFTSSGRVVYGGGGITPDVFVPIDTVTMNEVYLNLRPYIPEFTYQYFSKNKLLFPKTLPAFANDYAISQKVFDDFLDYAKEEGASIEDGSISYVIIRQLKRFMKARIAKHLFNDKGFFMVWNKEDQMILKALESIRSGVPISSN